MFRISCLITLTSRKLSGSQNTVWVQGDAAPGPHLATAPQRRLRRSDHVWGKCTACFKTPLKLRKMLYGKASAQDLGFLLYIIPVEDGSGRGTLKHATHWVTLITQ